MPLQPDTMFTLIDARRGQSLQTTGCWQKARGDEKIIREETEGVEQGHHRVPAAAETMKEELRLHCEVTGEV